MKIEATIEEHIHHFLEGVRAEGKSDKEALIIIHKYMKDGKITVAEETILRRQVMDSLKIVGIGIPFVLIPGASILMPIMLRVAKKYKIDLMPTAFK